MDRPSCGRQGIVCSFHATGKFAFFNRAPGGRNQACLLVRMRARRIVDDVAQDQKGHDVRLAEPSPIRDGIVRHVTNVIVESGIDGVRGRAFAQVTPNAAAQRKLRAHRPGNDAKNRGTCRLIDECTPHRTGHVY